jgi:hypothetical protein
MATDANSLLADVNCYQCAPPGQWQLLKLALLRQILLALDPVANTDVNSLLATVNCYQCLTPGLWQLLELALLKSIADAGGLGGGGSGGVLCSTADPTDDPGVTCALHYRTDTGELWSWNDGAGTWDQLLA